MLSSVALAALALAAAPGPRAALAEGGDAELAGWYELAPGRRALVTFGAGGGLRLYDFERPSFDVLERRADGDAFAWRRQREGDEGELSFERDARGAVVGLAWSAAGAEGRAPRDDAFGYAQEELSFASGEIELAGTLLLPRAAAGASRAPGAVILQGSGDSDRDNVWSFTIADALARAGIAVLIFDKRGCGSSRGDWKAVGFDELAADASAGLARLAARPEVDPARCGLVGLSQGGWVATLAASRDERVAWVAGVSNSAVPVRAQVLHELANTVRKGAPAGEADELVALAEELMAMAFAFGESGEGFEDYLAGVEAAPPALAGAFPRERDDWRWAWYARVLDFDPVPLLRGLGRPVLSVLGAEDERDNVPVAESVRRIEALRAEGVAIESRVYAGSGHALEDPATGWVRRDFLDELARWISARPARESRAR